MSALNIGGDKSDKSYRYKMPPLVTKIEGRGNGIKTVILNMVDVAKSLHTDPAYPTKYFGIELGAQSNFERKTERAVVNGKHETSTLANHLEKFIELFILCPNCHLPEIKMSVKKALIKIHCAACGYHQPLATNHKLTTYIIKNPPDADKKNKDAKGKKKKKDDESENAETENAEKEKEQEKEQEEKKEAVIAKPVKTTEQSVEWFSDTSHDAMKLRQKEEMEAARQASDVAAKRVQDLTRETPVSVMKMFLGVRRTPDEIVAEAKRLQLARGLNDSQKAQTIVQSIIDTSDVASIPAQFVNQKPVFALMATDRQNALMLINCIEELVASLERKVQGIFPKLLQLLYEKDVLDEDVLLAWYESPPESSWLVSRPVAVEMRKRAKALIDWLKSADEDDDDDDE